MVHHKILTSQRSEINLHHSACGRTLSKTLLTTHVIKLNTLHTHIYTTQFGWMEKNVPFELRYIPLGCNPLRALEPI